MTSFKGQTVAITGGASGIGFSLARQFGRDGANVVIGEPKQVRVDAAVSRLGAEGFAVAGCVMDVTDPTSVEAFAEFAWSRFGNVQVLINNAGVGAGMRSMVKLPLEELHRVMDVNFFGVWHSAAIFGRRMIEQGLPAAIYNLGSENSFFNAVPKNAAYIASKHAVRGLTEAMREEFPEFIRIGLICPGFVKSELTQGAFGELAMDTDEFAGKVFAQIKAGEFYIVTHPYNIERIRPIHEEVEDAFRRNAPRYAGDDEHDVRTLMARVRS
jgi:NAD(P)-dependent dehydrogenase (short-subunit alcohol dehydrogenase family)